MVLARTTVRRETGGSRLDSPDTPLTTVQQRGDHAPGVSRRRCHSFCINLAPTPDDSDDDAVNTEEKIWDLTQNINVKGVWYGCKHAVIAMRKVGCVVCRLPPCRLDTLPTTCRPTYLPTYLLPTFHLPTYSPYLRLVHFHLPPNLSTPKRPTAFPPIYLPSFLPTYPPPTCRTSLPTPPTHHCPYRRRNG